jgi:hypothetical protein
VTPPDRSESVRGHRDSTEAIDERELMNRTLDKIQHKEKTGASPFETFVYSKLDAYEQSINESLAKNARKTSLASLAPLNTTRILETSSLTEALPVNKIAGAFCVA